MKKIKYRYNRIDKSLIEYPVFTQPSMAFTPRQIIEQFASGEIIAQENNPTDDFYDDKYSEDQLFALHIIEDDFMLRQHVLDFYANQNEKENVSSGAASPQGSEGSSNKDDKSVQSSEPGEQD